MKVAARDGVARATRDTLGRLLRTESPLGHVIRYTYDAATATRYNPTQVHDSTRNLTQTYQYVAGTSYPTQSSGGLETPVWYDWAPTGVKKLTRVRRGVSSDVGTRYTYDTRGRATLVKDGRDHEQRAHYAATGFQNTDSTTQGLFRTGYTYDAYGRAITVKVPTNEVATTTYDLLNRVRTVTAPAQGTTTYRYGATVDTVDDAKGQRYRTVRNALGWVTQEIDPYGKSRHHAHDAHGNVVWTQNRRLQATTFTYDALDHLTSRTADGQTTGYATDPLGRWTATWNGESIDTLHFDGLGRDTLAVTIRDGTDRHVVRLAHNAKGQRTMMDYARPAHVWGFSVLSTYNARDQLATLSHLGGTTTFSYDDEGMLAGVRLPFHGPADSARSGSTHLHRPGSVDFSTAIPSLIALGRDYEYDAQSRMTHRLRGGGHGREFGYDAAGRLARHQDFQRVVSCTPIYMHDEPLPGEEPIGQECSQPPNYTGPQRTFQYDVVGNPLHGVNGAVVSGNRLLNYNGYTANHGDDDGNIVHAYLTADPAGTGYSAVWNTLGQIDSVWAAGQGWVDYGYDGWGRRVRKSHRGTGTTQRYVYDGEQIVTDYHDTPGTLPVHYSYYPGVDRPHAVSRNGSVYYYQQDAEGNVVGLTSQSGNLVSHYDYDPFGSHASTPVEAVPNRYRFKGREYDAETGLYYMRARYYDPRLGRFISEDPIGPAGGINPYTFAGNDPVNYRDPSGLCTKMATVMDTYWSDGSVTRRVLGYYWEGEDCDDQSGGGGGDSRTGRMDPQQPSPRRQPPGCPLNLTPVQRRAGLDALRRSFRAGAERATAVVGNGIVPVPFRRADSVSMSGLRIPAGATLVAHGHLRFLGGHDTNYGSLSTTDSIEANRIGLPFLAYSVDSISMIVPGGPIATCPR